MERKISEEPFEGHHMCVSKSRQADLHTASLREKLNAMVDNLPSSGVTLAAIRDLVGPDGLLVLTAFLTIVFLVPVSIPGISTVFGGAILLIGISRLIRRNLWLPKPIAERELPADTLREVLYRGAKWLHSLERVSRPHRLSWLVSARLAHTVNNCALIAGAALLMAPLGLIPFSNTLPALALLFLSIGLLQSDGLCVLYGHLLNLATVVYFAVLILGGSIAVGEAFQHLVGSAF
jgi:hypothetical protein